MDLSAYQQYLQYVANSGDVAGSITSTDNGEGGGFAFANNDWLSNPTGLFDIGYNEGNRRSLNPYYSTQVRDAMRQVATQLGLTPQAADQAALQFAQQQFGSTQQGYTDATSPAIVADAIAKSLYQQAGKPYQGLTPEQYQNALTQATANQNFNKQGDEEAWKTDSVGGIVAFGPEWAQSILEPTSDNPERALLGAEDPLGTGIWNQVLGQDWDPTINETGGPTSDAYAKSADQNIDTSGVSVIQQALDTAAKMIGGPAASEGIGAGMESAGVDPTYAPALTAAAKAGAGGVASGESNWGDLLEKMILAAATSDQSGGVLDAAGEAYKLQQAYQNDNPFGAIGAAEGISGGAGDIFGGSSDPFSNNYQPQQDDYSDGYYSAGEGETDQTNWWEPQAQQQQAGTTDYGPVQQGSNLSGLLQQQQAPADNNFGNLYAQGNTGTVSDAGPQTGGDMGEDDWLSGLGDVYSGMGESPGYTPGMGAEDDWLSQIGDTYGGTGSVGNYTPGMGGTGSSVPSWLRSLIGNLPGAGGGSASGTGSGLAGMLGSLGPALIGAMGAQNVANKQDAAAQRWEGYGAPYRDKLAATYADPNAWLQSAEVQAPVQQGTDALMRSLSVQGNPFGSGAALQQGQNYAANQLFGRLGEERNRLGGLGGLASFQAAAPGAANNAAVSGGQRYGLGAFGADQYLNQPKSLAQQLYGLV